LGVGNYLEPQSGINGFGLLHLFDILTANIGMLSVDTVQIPNRSLFRQPEVCEIAQVQPYVLRSWEAEFPDLGVSKGDGAPRVYRKADVERVLRIKQLLFVEGLTLAGARRRMQEEHGPAPSAPPLDDLLTRDARERILSVRKSLRELASLLSRRPAAAGAAAFELAAPTPRASVKKKAAAKPVKKRGR
jgi:DNA-binding transcriptional MerR regulator